MIVKEAPYELKPCPFCGNKPEISGSDNVNGHPHWYVHCRNCGGSQWGKHNIRTAVEQWNRRVK